MRFSSLFAAGPAVAILSIALLCGLSGTAISETATGSATLLKELWNRWGPHDARAGDGFRITLSAGTQQSAELRTSLWATSLIDTIKR
jgi:hypothetical protein